MNNENTMTSFPCRDSQTDGCPNTVTVADSHCADCAEFHASMAEAKTLLADDSWKSPADSIAAVDAALAPLVAGFEVVEVNVLPNPPAEIIVNECDLVLTEEADKPDLDSVCYTMNAAEVDAQAALFEIVAVLGKYQETLKQIDTVLASYEVH